MLYEKIPNELIRDLDGQLYPYNTSERAAARNHFLALESLSLPKGVSNLYIFDRGYPSKELLSDMIEANMFFLIRVRKKFNHDFDWVDKKGKVTFKTARSIVFVSLP